MNLFQRFQQLITEPAPDVLFEVTESSIAAVSPQNPAGQRQEILPERAAMASPAAPNLLKPALYRDAINALISAIPAKRKAAALVIPDYAVRMTIVDLEDFPANEEEQVALLRFRLRKTVPFPIEDAQLSYSLQRNEPKRVEVMTVVVARPILDEYEALFRPYGYRIGRVLPSSLATLPICPAGDRGLSVLAKMAGETLSVLLLDEHYVRLIRCLDLTGEAGSQEAETIVPALQQTLAYAEDHLRMPVTRLLLSGFGTDTEGLGSRVETALGLPYAPLRSKFGITTQVNSGLLGLLERYAG